MKDIRTGYQTAISIQGMLLYLMSLSVKAACDLMKIGLSDSHAYAYDSNF